MSQARFRFAYRQNASRLHRAIGEALRAPHSPFSGHQIFQEYPVSKVNPSYKNPLHTFDWVIPSLFLVIEGHGEQHYEAVTFGGIEKEEARERLFDQMSRDNSKLNAATRAGFLFLEIPYTDLEKINTSFLWDLYTSNLDKMPTADSMVYTQQEEAKKRRHEQYKRRREWQNQTKRGE